MSIEAISWAFKQTARPRNKLVLIMLADAAPADRNAFKQYPLQRLAALTGLSIRAVINCINDLEQAGLVGVMPDLLDDASSIWFNLQMGAAQ